MQNLIIIGKLIKENILTKKSIQIMIIILCIIFWCISQGISQEAQTYYENGYQYFSQENYQKAEENYQKAIEIDPNFENAHYWLGKVYRQTGQYEKAIPQWIEVLRINPRNAYAFRYLNSSFNDTSRVQSALASDYLSEGLKILDVKENSFFLFSNNITNYTFLSAIPYFQKVTTLENNNVFAQYWIAQIYQALSKKISWQYTSLAINSFEKVIEIEEDNNPYSFERPREYWYAYQELMKIYLSLGLNESRENLLDQLESIKAMPYSQVLQDAGYYDFGFPDSIEIINTDTKETVELWGYDDKEKTFRVVNKEVIGEENISH